MHCPSSTSIGSAQPSALSLQGLDPRVRYSFRVGIYTHCCPLQLATIEHTLEGVSILADLLSRDAMADENVVDDSGRQVRLPVV